jgi:D-serine deaminase-like pyridoxal phosphate-dependent protein
MIVRAPARVGDPIRAIDTPALVIDADALERNIAALAAFARERGLALRPHAKTHKSARIAQLQIEAGAVGVCVQKVSEAQALAAAGVSQLYVSNEVVDPAKVDRLAELARSTRLAVAVDSPLGVERLGRALARSGASMDVFVEVDVGHGRCGLPPGSAAALARHVCGDPHMRFGGLQAYHGRAQHLRSAGERGVAIRHAASIVRAAQAALSGAGIACPLVTGAGTGTFTHEAASGVWGELQCGSYVFMDRDYADNEPLPQAPRFEHALFVKSQVMSRGTSHAVIDAGHKSHALDSGPPSVWGAFAGIEFANGGDEHGILRAGAGPGLPALGDAVWLVPGHCDPTVNLHDMYVVVRGGLERGVVEALWPIDARGCVG